MEDLVEELKECQQTLQLNVQDEKVHKRIVQILIQSDSCQAGSTWKNCDQLQGAVNYAGKILGMISTEANLMDVGNMILPYDTKLASQYYEKVVQMNPSSIRALVALGHLKKVFQNCLNSVDCEDWERLYNSIGVLQKGPWNRSTRCGNTLFNSHTLSGPFTSSLVPLLFCWYVW